MAGNTDSVRCCPHCDGDPPVGESALRCFELYPVLDTCGCLEWWVQDELVIVLPRAGNRNLAGVAGYPVLRPSAVCGAWAAGSAPDERVAVMRTAASSMVVISVNNFVMVHSPF